MSDAERQREEDAFLESYLRDRSISCPSCRYDLRNLAGNHCPECGQHLCIRVTLHEPNWRSYVTGLVALSMSTGFSALLLIYALLVVATRSRGGLPVEFIITVVVGLLISAATLSLWIRTSRWLRRRGPATRWTLALACLVIPLTNVVMFAIFVN